MTLGAQVASQLPYLRRYARALTGSQSTGDAFVRATLEAALADPQLKATLREGRVPLYRAFNKVWSSAYLEVPVEDKPLGSGLEVAAQARLAAITPLNRQALLLTTLEERTKKRAKPRPGQGLLSLASLAQGQGERNSVIPEGAIGKRGICCLARFQSSRSSGK